MFTGCIHNTLSCRAGYTVGILTLGAELFNVKLFIVITHVVAFRDLAHAASHTYIIR